MNMQIRNISSISSIYSFVIEEWNRYRILLFKELVQLAGIYSFLCLTLLQVLNQLIGFLLNLMVELRGREGNGIYCLVYRQKGSSGTWRRGF